LNYGSFQQKDFLNGEGVRNSLFVSGCHFHCNGCFNAKAWNPDYGNPYTQETENMIIDSLKNPVIDGLSLLGGEPFESDHTYELTKLLKRVRKECPDKNIWSWSGFKFEDLIQDENKLNMLKLIDVLVDGQFELNKRDISLAFRGSSNQRIINVPLSLQANKPILWHEED
jgi:anaerobic ribonucleoside-triphosphate reductase activating protein